MPLKLWATMSGDVPVSPKMDAEFARAKALQEYLEHMEERIVQSVNRVGNEVDGLRQRMNANEVAIATLRVSVEAWQSQYGRDRTEHYQRDDQRGSRAIMLGGIVASIILGIVNFLGQHWH